MKAHLEDRLKFARVKARAWSDKIRVRGQERIVQPLYSHLENFKTGIEGKIKQYK